MRNIDELQDLRAGLILFALNRFVRVEVAECFKIDLNNEGSFHSLLAAYLAGLPRKIEAL